MLAAIGVRLDMSGLQGGEGLLSGNCATPIVIVGDHHAEGALTEAWSNEVWSAVTRAFTDSGSYLHIMQAVHAFPECQALRIACVIGLEGDDVVGPTVGRLYPLEFGQEERLSQDAAPDGEIGAVVGIDLAVFGNSATHFLGGRGAIGPAEGFPSQGPGESCAVGENATADDKVMWRVQLEQEQFARLQRLEIDRGRCPEIDFGQIGLTAEHVEPGFIGDGDNQLDAHSISPRAKTRVRVAVEVRRIIYCLYWRMIASAKSIAYGARTTGRAPRLRVKSLRNRRDYVTTICTACARFWTVSATGMHNT